MVHYAGTRFANYWVGGFTMADNPSRTINRFDPTDTPESDPVPTGEDVVHRQKEGHETPRRYDAPASKPHKDAGERARE